MKRLSIKQFEQATKIMQWVKALDAEINSIEKFALMIANNEVNTTFTLNIDNLTAKSETEGRITIDEHGDMKPYEKFREMSEPSFSNHGLYMFHQIIGRIDRTNSNDPNKHKISYPLNENATMQVLGVILADRMERRKFLMDKLNKMGIGG